MNTTPSPSSPVPPTPQPRLTICPYCGARSRSLAACESCGGRFDPLSRQATQNAMGPWFVRIESQPFRPGCNYATLMHLIERGTVRADTAVRGPTTKQFWMLARWCPGVAHRLGICHSCQAKVDPESRDCTSCGAEFGEFEDRQALGLGEVRPLPGRTAPAAMRQTGLDQHAPAVRSDPRDSIARADDTGGVSPADRDDISEDLGDEGIRELRLRRDLRRSKRWTAVWSVLALVTLTGLSGYVIFQQLDLGSGPVGRWLAARETNTASDPAGVVTGPDAGSHHRQRRGTRTNSRLWMRRATGPCPRSSRRMVRGSWGRRGRSPRLGKSRGRERRPGRGCGPCRVCGGSADGFAVRANCGILPMSGSRACWRRSAAGIRRSTTCSTHPRVEPERLR